MMARESSRRTAEAKARRPEAELRRFIASAASPPPRPLALDGSGFDLIAEIKLRSPAAGRLEAAGTAADAADSVRRRARSYAGAGAAAISVVTEPSRFDGDIAHLAAAADAVTIPVMRKDFIVDPYQVLEARAAGASGVLLIVRLVENVGLGRLI